MRTSKRRSLPMKYLHWNFSVRSRPSDKRCARFIRQLVLLSLFLPASHLLSQEQPQDKDRFEIDLSELQKEVDKVADKPYSLGGFAEFQPTLLVSTATLRHPAPASIDRSRTTPSINITFACACREATKKIGSRCFSRPTPTCATISRGGTKILRCSKPTHRPSRIAASSSRLARR